jgi:PIN domain nuclease of toxin-antitoxin system
MTRLPSGRIVADASFLIAVAEQDQAATRFVAALSRCEITSVNFGEVCYKLHQTTGVDARQTTSVFVQAMRVAVQAVELAHVLLFPHLKHVDAASRAAQLDSGAVQVKSLSLADLTCLAYATATGDLPVLTGDKHWTTLAAQGLTVPVFDYRDPSLTL